MSRFQPLLDSGKGGSVNFVTSKLYLMASAGKPCG